jgi:hypothetical protein
MGHLAERLKEKFGRKSIFMDIDTIQPRTDFTEALRSAVGECDVLLAMIGPKWSVAKNTEGETREDPNDWIRMELTTALSRNIPLFPMLVGAASLPETSMLPDDLKKVFHYQTHELTDKRCEYDSTQLIQILEKVGPCGEAQAIHHRHASDTALDVGGIVCPRIIAGCRFDSILEGSWVLSEQPFRHLINRGCHPTSRTQSKQGISKLKQYPPIEAIHILVVFTNFNYLVYSGSKVTGQYLDRHAKLVPFLDYLARDRQSTLL